VTIEGLGPILPAFVFLISTFAFWGVGEVLLSCLRVSASVKEPMDLGRLLLGLTLGIGGTAHVLYVLGNFFDFYQPGFIALLLVGGCGLALWRLRCLRFSISWFGRLKTLSLFEWLVLALVGMYAIMWLSVLSGFATGTDVFSHHYPHVKAMTELKHFGHSKSFPYGLDHISLTTRASFT
jgi:hypothetical protein